MTLVLVTGGAGFIGSHLVEALVRRGDRVRVLDNFTTGKKENLASVWDQIELIEGDIRDRSAVCRAVAGVEQIFHQAALVSVPLSVQDPLANHTVNVDGTFNLLNAAREAEVQTFVYASSAAVYGDLPDPLKVESVTPAPLSPYGLAKRIGEEYAALFTHLYGLNIVCLRYFNVYGPRQDPHSPYSGVISIFLERARTGQPATIFGDGHQRRDFVYVGDVVRANLMAAACPAASGRVFNVGTGHATTILRLWDLVQTVVGVRLPAQFAPERAGDVRHSVADPDLARRVLGFEARTPLLDGLRETWEWYRSARDHA